MSNIKSLIQGHSLLKRDLKPLLTWFENGFIQGKCQTTKVNFTDFEVPSSGHKWLAPRLVKLFKYYIQGF